VWARNLLFIGLCLCGLASLGYALLPGQRTTQPETFRPNRAKHDDFGTTLANLDVEFEYHWQRNDLQPAERADDYTIARRLSLGLTGTVPSLEELRALEDVPSEQRVEWWVSHILEDRRYSDFVAERFARAYVGVENGPFLVYRRRRFATWLSDQLYKNDLPYDALVRELISGEGLWTGNPEVNFVTVTIDQDETGQPDPIRLAGRTVRAFLGMRIDCLQCHDEFRVDDPAVFPTPDGGTREGEQTDFHGIAAFWAEAQSSPRGIRDEEGKEYLYKFLYDDEETTVTPQPPYLPELVPEKGNRREKLAAWVTHPENKPFARATVNRVWAIMTGRPLHTPIDNIPLTGSDMPGLDLLANDFIAHKYDLHRLIRLIAASKAFQVDSEADHEITKRHEDLFAAFPLSRLRPEQVAGSIIQASSLTTINADAHIFSQLAKYNETNDFVKRFGDSGEDEFDERGGTIPQRNQMMNGKLVKERTKENILMAATRIAALAPDDEAAIKTAFLVVLSREPVDEEMAIFLPRLKGKKKGDRNAAMEDIYWVLINSTEFSWNH